ncbi:MAG: DUF2771 family protein [Kibdelosporangium sp.]
MRFLRIALPAVGGLLLAACSAPHPPEVTFFADGTTIRLSPAQFCKPNAERCDGNADARGRMPVPGGKPLNISVPTQVADAPWVVLFKYRKADGSEEQGRTEVFKAGDKYAYTLNLPTAGDQLTDVEVQRIANITAGADNDVVFLTDASWVLEVTS